MGLTLGSMMSFISDGVASIALICVQVGYCFLLSVYFPWRRNEVILVDCAGIFCFLSASISALHVNDAKVPTMVALSVVVVFLFIAAFGHGFSLAISKGCIWKAVSHSSDCKEAKTAWLLGQLATYDYKSLRD